MNHRKAEGERRLDELARNLGIDSILEDANSQSVGVSEELDQLLWLFAEGDLSDQDEERLWMLAAQEPAALRHFQHILQSISAHDRPEFGVLPDSVRKRLQADLDRRSLASPTVPNAMDGLLRQAAALGSRIADISVQVARDFLAVGDRFGMLSPSLARSADERRTTYTHTLLRRIGVLELDIDHAGNGLCHLTLRVSQPNASYPLDTLQVQLRQNASDASQTATISNGAVRFADLTPGRYTIDISQDSIELDGVDISLEAYPAT